MAIASGNPVLGGGSGKIGASSGGTGSSYFSPMDIVVGNGASGLTTCAVYLGSDGMGGTTFNFPIGSAIDENSSGNLNIEPAATGVNCAGTFSAYSLWANTTSGLGYIAGAGGVTAQLTSRTTAVTLNKACGNITLVSALGTPTWQTFTVNNNVVAAGDLPLVAQVSGADKYELSVTAIGTSSFAISFATTGGTTTEQPVFRFSILKGATS